MKRYRFTLAALMVFAALLAWVLTQERGRVPQEGEIFRLATDQISKLEITRGDEKIVLTQRDGQWHLAEPVAGLAATDTVKDMLETLVELKPGKREEADATDPQYGLQKPAVTVTFETSAGQRSTIKVGEQTPVGRQYFATISGRPGLYLVSTLFKTTMEQSVDELRDKQIVRVEQDKISKLTIKHPKETIVAERVTVGDGEQWRLRQPVKARADYSAIKDVLRAVTSAKAAAFEAPPEDLSTVGLAKPKLVVTLTTTGGKELTVRLGKETEKEVAQEYGQGSARQRVTYIKVDNRPQLLLAYTSLADSVDKDSFALRDKTILRLVKDDVIGVRVQAKNTANFDVRKNDQGDWILKAPAGTKADGARVDSVLWDLEDLQATAFEEEQPEDLQKYGLAVPQAVISLTVRGQNEPAKITFGKQASPQTRYCQTSRSRQVYQVRDTVLEGLPTSIEELIESASEEKPEAPDFPVAPDSQ